jgi:hypothetical protein
MFFLLLLVGFWPGGWLAFLLAMFFLSLLAGSRPGRRLTFSCVAKRK